MASVVSFGEEDMAATFGEKRWSLRNRGMETLVLMIQPDKAGAGPNGP